MKNRTLGEPDAHVMMRSIKTMLLVLLCLALAATILLVIFHPPSAYLAGLPIPALFLLYIGACFLERRATAKMLRHKRETSISAEEVEMDVQYAGIYTSLALAVLLAISAIVMAATMVENWSMVGASAAFILLLSIFYVVPYIPFFIADAEQDERDKLRGEAQVSRSPNDKT